VSTSKALIISYSISGTGGILYLIFHHIDPLIPFLIIFSRVGNSMSFNTIYIANSRLFPTKLLATAFGACNLVAHIVAIIAPLIAEIPDPFPFIVFVILTGVAGVSSILIKEMKSEDKDEEETS
jgi:hypothetical protein